MAIRQVMVRKRNQAHSTKNILSLTMFRLRTQRAWSILTVPVREPVGNWHDVTVGNNYIEG